MSKKTGKSLVFAFRPWGGIVLGVLILMTSCSPGNKWVEVESFSTTKNKTITASHRFRIQPVEDGDTLIKNTGITFEATFTCTRQEGEDEGSYKTSSHFNSRSAGKGGLAIDQSMNSLILKTWPAGVDVQEVKISCPFFPFEIQSDRIGDVYFYLVDDEDGTCMSNIIMIPVEIKVAAE